MKSEIVYMLGVIAVGFAVNFSLRALPFLLFGGRGRAIPAWIDRLSGFISPVIIAGLIVYSYSGSAWRTPWPYLAGVVTVALQVWKRNPLMSIVAGTAVYMLLLNCCGCATHQVRELDAKNPELRMTSTGIYMGEERLDAKDILDALEDAEIPRDRAIHILLDRDMKDLRAPRALMALLSRGGYTRSVLVTSEHGQSTNKSGKSYEKEAAQAQRSDDYIFYVTENGVTYGILTEVGPDDVAKCLERDQARPDSLIRICGREEDFMSEKVMPFMLQLEDCLREAGYANIRRFWLKSAKPGERTVRTNAEDGFGSPERRAPAPTRTVNGIRYKGAGE